MFYRFKGGIDTFENLPLDIETYLNKIGKNTYFSKVFPPWETKGKLDLAVKYLHEWLIEEKTQGDFDSIILCGHSMGGLLISDLLLFDIRDYNASLNISAILSLDTPFLGLNPIVFSNQTSKLFNYYNDFTKIKDLATSSAMLAPFIGTIWGSSNQSQNNNNDTQRNNNQNQRSRNNNSQKFSTIAGMTAAGLTTLGIAGYFNRHKLFEAYQWTAEQTVDHLLFLSNLWNVNSLKERLNNVLSTKKTFVNIYSHLPKQNSTFCLLPFDIVEENEGISKCFIRNSNTLASDEVAAHVG